MGMPAWARGRACTRTRILRPMHVHVHVHVQVLFQESVKVLMKKAADIAGLLGDAVQGQAGAA